MGIVPDLEGRVCLVTGGSRGIGRAIVLALAEAGGDVAINCRARIEDAQAVAALVRAIGRRAVVVPADVSQSAAVTQMIATIEAALGPIDVLINNAGVAPRRGIDDLTEADFDATIAINLKSAFLCTQAVLPHMRAAGGGRIINIGSVLGLLPMPYGALYSATKHALEGYSESLDHEIRPSGVRVSVVEPAFTQIRFDANLLAPDATREEYRGMRAHLSALLPKQIAQGDDPGIVADVVLRAVTDSRPRIRYTAGKAAATLALLRRFAPAAIVDRGIRQSFKLDAIPL